MGKRFYYTPNDYSPTYEVEVLPDQLIKVHSVRDIPEYWPESKIIANGDDMPAHYIKYINGYARDAVLERSRQLGK